MELMSEIFDQYSKYTGTGIFMVLFFVSLVYIAITEKNEKNKIVLLYGSVAVMVTIFIPIVYFLYVKFVDTSTYWRMWWLVPVGIGLAYVGTKLIEEHRFTGLLLALLIMILGGQLVYTSNAAFTRVENRYQLPMIDVQICDLIESTGEENIMLAVPVEFLSTIRQYDSNIQMPYGREQLDENWGFRSGFYDAINADKLNFEELKVKCILNNTNFIVVNNLKEYLNYPEDNGFEFVGVVGVYEIYKFLELEDIG